MKKLIIKEEVINFTIISQQFLTTDNPFLPDFKCIFTVTKIHAKHLHYTYYFLIKTISHCKEHVVCKNLPSKHKEYHKELLVKRLKVQYLSVKKIDSFLSSE